MSRPLIIAALALGAAACAQPFAGAPSSNSASTAQRPPRLADAARGLAFAEQRCAGCHGVTQNSSSPNPEAPPFEDIANRPEVTRSTLEQFLRNSHNYPAVMNFTIDAAQVRDLASYLTTLQKPDYRPVG